MQSFTETYCFPLILTILTHTSLLCASFPSDCDMVSINSSSGTLYISETSLVVKSVRRLWNSTVKNISALDLMPSTVQVVMSIIYEDITNSSPTHLIYTQASNHHCILKRFGETLVEIHPIFSRHTLPYKLLGKHFMPRHKTRYILHIRGLWANNIFRNQNVRSSSLLFSFFIFSFNFKLIVLHWVTRTLIILECHHI